MDNTLTIMTDTDKREKEGRRENKAVGSVRRVKWGKQEGPTRRKRESRESVK